MKRWMNEIKVKERKIDWKWNWQNNRSSIRKWRRDLSKEDKSN